MASNNSLDVKARLDEAIAIQRRRIYEFGIQKKPVQRDYNEAMRCMAMLLKEARSFVKDNIRYSKSLSLEEKREVIVGWFATLPTQQKRQLLDELNRSMDLGIVRKDERTG